MLRKIALSAGISFFLVTTIIAVLDYVRLLYRPVIESDWQLHYALLVATPIDAAMHVYAQAVFDYFVSPIPSFAMASGTALLVMLQRSARDRGGHPLGRAFARWCSRAITLLLLQNPRSAIAKLATRTTR